MKFSLNRNFTSEKANNNDVIRKLALISESLNEKSVGIAFSFENLNNHILNLNREEHDLELAEIDLQNKYRVSMKIIVGACFREN